MFGLPRASESTRLDRYGKSPLMHDGIVLWSRSHMLHTARVDSRGKRLGSAGPFNLDEVAMLMPTHSTRGGL